LQPARRSPTAGRLDTALKAAHDACLSTAAARGVRLSVPADAAAVVTMDADRLALVFINLIENAIKHGCAGGRVEVGADLTDARSVSVWVDDDGAGIAPADCERVFSLGERGTTAASGHGIGLALVRLLLERDGGGIHNESSPLGGSRFRVLLPRANGG